MRRAALVLLLLALGLLVPVRFLLLPHLRSYGLGTATLVRLVWDWGLTLCIAGWVMAWRDFTSRLPHSGPAAAARSWLIPFWVLQGFGAIFALLAIWRRLLMELAAPSPGVVQAIRVLGGYWSFGVVLLLCGGGLMLCIASPMARAEEEASHHAKSAAL